VAFFSYEPWSFEKAKEEEVWRREVMNEEMKSIKKNNTWKLVISLM